VPLQAPPLLQRRVVVGVMGLFAKLVGAE